MADDPLPLASNLKSHRRAPVAICVVLLALLVAFGALLIQNNLVAAERSLEERFHTRASLTAAFARDYVADIAQRERFQAEKLLGGPEVDQATFEQVVQSLGFDAAVLLDGMGRLLHVWPRRPEIIGRDLTVDYPHLRTAVAGEVGVSERVVSAALHVPVAAIAVPYPSAEGRRVISGAFSPKTTPLGAYFASATPIAGGAGYLVDRSGGLLAARQGADELPEEVGAVSDRLSRIDTHTGTVTVAVAQVEGTPWRVVLTVPSDELFAPVADGRWAPWALLGALAFSGVLVLVLFVRLGRARAEAIYAARTDLLTDLPNRRAVDEWLARVAAHVRRHREPLAVLMIDLDHFKAINDEHGHEIGDLALQQAAEVLRRSVRSGDIAGRWGGEEFLVVLPTTGVEEAVAVAERLRMAVADADVRVGRNEIRLTVSKVRMTVSIGVASLGEDGDVEALLRAADAALYKAKAGGRDAVEVASTPHGAGRTTSAAALTPAIR